MEKRTIIAFALSFLILLLWSLFFGPKENPVPHKETAQAPSAVKKAAAPSKTAGPEATPLALSGQEAFPKAPKNASAIQEKEVVVDTPLYQAVFTNLGPTVKSLKLKKYRETAGKNSPLVDLVSLPKGMGEPLLVRFVPTSSTPHHGVFYQVEEDSLRVDSHTGPRDLVFRGLDPSGMILLQKYRFYPGQYRIDLDLEVTNPSDKGIEGHFSAQLRALPTKKKGYYSYVGLVTLLDDHLKQVKVKKVSEPKNLEGVMDWVAYEDTYFLTAVIPEKALKAYFKGELMDSGLLSGTYTLPPVQIGPSQRTSFDWRLYFGPLELTTLKKFGKKLDRAVDFGWTDIIAKPLLYVLRLFYRFIGNYGVAIILLTVLIKILFWPLTHKSYKSMKEMQKLQPRMAKIREKYKDNREQLNKEMMALYKTYKVNPMGGCLPMVIQIPVFFALYRILGKSIELRHAPFIWWINDLSAPDRLFHFSFKIPFMSPPYGIPMLTLLMGASMFVQQKMTPTPGDPTQAKFMMFLPIIFTFMFVNFPSGLVLYWLVNNLLSIGQQYRIHKSSV